MRAKLYICMAPPRSGLTALTGCLSLLGIEPPNHQPDAETINALLFQDLGLSPLTAAPLSKDWLTTDAARIAGVRIENLLEELSTSDKDYFIFDPLLCRVLPLWQNVWKQIEIDPVFLLMLRHPFETARSLSATENLNFTRAHLTWISYTRDAQRALEGEDHTLITFDQLLADPISTLNALKHKTHNLQSTTYNLLKFIQSSLKHHHAGDMSEQNRQTFEPYERFYQQIRTASYQNTEHSFYTDTNTLLPLVDSLLATAGQQENQTDVQARKPAPSTESPLQASIILAASGGAEETVEIVDLKEEQWQKIGLVVPEFPSIQYSQIILRPLNTNGIISIASIAIVNKATAQVLWSLEGQSLIDALHIKGHAIKLPDEANLTLLITGSEPRISFPKPHFIRDFPLDLIIWIKASRSQELIRKYLNLQTKALEYISNRILHDNFPKFVNDYIPGMPDYSELTEQFLSTISNKLLNARSKEREEALHQVEEIIQSITGKFDDFKLSLSKINSSLCLFYLLHVTDDHIPKNIVKSGSFYELEYLEILKNFYQKGEFVIDCGANIGNHAIYFAKILEANVLAFEPEPHNAVCLVVNIAINNIQDKVYPIRYGLGKNNGYVDLQMIIDKNFGSFSGDPELTTTNEELKDSFSISSPVKTIDQSLDDLKITNPVAIIKIDVEGMETDVLEGAVRVISQSLPAIGVECNGRSQLERVKNILFKFNYFYFEVTNWTPTFVFLSRDNPFHMNKLIEYLEKKTKAAAFKEKYFE
ncbi:MAG: FkbM family methyltransferase [Desulfobacterales bacterium]|nr:FkbM family methyltransferase [Desulfobacterales bacterium]